MNCRRRNLLCAGFAALGTLWTSLAAADLPAPEGKTHVAYSFELKGSASGVVLVAFPLYASDGGQVAPLRFEHAQMMVQGFQPGIYSLAPDDAASIRGNGDQAAVAALLAAKGHVCVKQVPRVFTVPSSTKIASITDVFRIDATPASCRASFVQTVYGGEHGEHGVGTVDASGRRLVPSPFDDDALPEMGDLGFTLVDPVAPPRGPRGCGSCVVVGAHPRLDAGALLALAVGLTLTRRRRSDRS